MAKLDVRNFSNIFNKSITNYAKFNWLSNGLPDGEYNGIKKVTFTMVKSINHNCRALIANTPFIPSASTDTKWPYGFSNYEVATADDTFGGVNKACVSVDPGSVAFVRVPTIEQTVEAYNAYLKEHPLIIYYYDKNDWGGVYMTAQGLTLAGCWYAENVFPTSRPPYGDIRDVQGYYAFVGNLGSTQSYADYPEDQLIGGNPLIPARLNIKDTGYKTKTALLNDKFPRAIVYRLSDTQSLSMQSEDESQTTCQQT